MLGQSMELKQMDRAVALAEAASTGSAEEAMAADGSGATRIIPVMNVFTKTDVTQLETWIGKKAWKRTNIGGSVQTQRYMTNMVCWPI